MKTLRTRLIWCALGAILWTWGCYPHSFWHHLGAILYVAGLATAWSLSYVAPRRWQ